MRFERVGLGTEHVDYHWAWDLQRRVHAEVVAGEREDTVLLLEHAGVYTAGKRTASWDRPTDGTPVVDVDRGGRITWHGPGQLIAYPIVRLREPVDVVAYVRALEQAVIDLAAGNGVATTRVAGRSGVWVTADARGRDRKLCAVGVRVAKGVTMHGIAINACPDLSAYDRIVPCGIDDADVTSLSAETGRTITPLDIVDATEDQLARALATRTRADEPAPAVRP
ncbi:lipoyl(octanoyl) transferase LipB [Georgenia thermotolerans]|uniref:Octanoyltransferase n=1 Tax=Georgenia thermotolerans TaxID=527326 RepID=A0A7J5URM7_9MICO|nr:lipoyl(octanoyl) transferase LipB [Georgenia thermotolerans]KAE8765112.1 lipoyl(octanoyl) transferase LipB [Georgenia thermotolerans]